MQCGGRAGHTAVAAGAGTGVHGPARGTVATAAAGHGMNRPSTASTAIVADDEDLGRLLLAESAEQSGLTALAYDNGVAALNAALSHDVAIVLLDVDMPGMDGYSVCRRLRAERRLANVPIVMVTGHEDAIAVRLAFEAGATDFISKPVNWPLLTRRIEYILRNAAGARALAEHVEQVQTLIAAIPDTLWVVSADGGIHWRATEP